MMPEDEQELTQSTQLIQTQSSSLLSEDNTETAQPEALEPPRRGRGRPRKIRPEGEEDRPRRKRGRPRKERPEGEEERPRRRRGRPRKDERQEGNENGTGEPGLFDAANAAEVGEFSEAPSDLSADLDLDGDTEITAEADEDEQDAGQGSDEQGEEQEEASYFYYENGNEEENEDDNEDDDEDEDRESDGSDEAVEAVEAVEVEDAGEPAVPEPEPVMMETQPEPVVVQPHPQEEFTLQYDVNSKRRYVDATSQKTEFERVLEELAKISRDMLSWEVDKFTLRFTKKYQGDGGNETEATAKKYEAFLGGFITNAAMELYDRGYPDTAFHYLEQTKNVLEARRKLETEVESIKARQEDDTVVDVSDILGLFGDGD